MYMTDNLEEFQLLQFWVVQNLAACSSTGEQLQRG